MTSETRTIFGGDAAITIDALGAHRRCADINRYERTFLVLAICSIIFTDVLTIIRLAEVPKRDEDFAYALLILVNSVFLLLFLVTGLLFQRITDMAAFLISDILLTIYVIIHFVARWKERDTVPKKDTYIFLIRLCFTCIFNVCVGLLSIATYSHYSQGGIFARRAYTYSEDRRPLITYYRFDGIARINTMLSISLCMLNLYNFNQLEVADTVLLSIGIPWTLLWLGIGIGMVRIENYKLVGFFCLLSFWQPGFIIYCLISVINYSPPSTATTIRTTASSSSYMTITSSTSPFTTITSLTPLSRSIIPVVQALYMCIAINILTHILSMIFAYICVRNFNKGLKEKIFNNQVDKWFQERYSNT